MTNTDTFNVSGKGTEAQKREFAERERVQNIGKIADGGKQRQAYTMLNDRDHLLNQKRSEAAQSIENRVQEELRKQGSHKPSMQPKPPAGAKPATLQERESSIRKMVQGALSEKYEDGVRSIEALENKKIDGFVQETLQSERLASKDQSKQKSTKNPDAELLNSVAARNKAGDGRQNLSKEADNTRNRSR